MKSPPALLLLSALPLLLLSLRRRADATPGTGPRHQPQRSKLFLDDAAVRSVYAPANVQANELLYRRADIEDVVQAHLCAIERAPALGFGRYIVSATTPFAQADLQALHDDAAAVVERLFPECRDLYEAQGWRLFPRLDRVYVNDAARRDLHWRPRYAFAHVLDCLRAGRDFRSPLAREVGAKGYHAAVFEGIPYPVE